MRHAMALAKGVQLLPPCHAQRRLEAAGRVVQACRRDAGGIVFKQIELPGAQQAAIGRPVAAGDGHTGNSPPPLNPTCVNDLAVAAAGLGANPACRLQQQHAAPRKCQLSGDGQANDSSTDNSTLGVRLWPASSGSIGGGGGAAGEQALLCRYRS